MGRFALIVEEDIAPFEHSSMLTLVAGGRKTDFPSLVDMPGSSSDHNEENELPHFVQTYSV